MKTKLLFLHALSPLHAGTGQGIDVIDLPIAREQATNIPYLPGSSIKGCLRDVFYGHEHQHALFGPDIQNASEYASAVTFTDARLLLLPVRSLKNVFVYATSPYLLERFARDAKYAGLKPPEIPKPEPSQACLSVQTLAQDNTLVLEDLDLKPANVHVHASAWATWIAEHMLPEHERESLTSRFVVLNDTIMTFLLETATEVVARIKLEDDTKTVAKGALWYEENLPTESVLTALIMTSAAKQTSSTLKTSQEAMDTLLERTTGIVQFGGKATVGRGLCRIKAV
jgi:CRISPR-associated protein Cmr4